MGTRRVGKTVLVQTIRKKYTSETLVLNAEDFDVQEILRNRSVANYKRIAGKASLLIIDEAQAIPEIGQVLKLMIDNTEVSKTWWHKKVLLTGVSTGRAGNLRGMEHLTGTLLHLKMLVHPNRLPISVVDRLLDSANRFSDAGTLKAIDIQLEEFLSF